MQIPTLLPVFLTLAIFVMDPGPVFGQDDTAARGSESSASQADDLEVLYEPDDAEDEDIEVIKVRGGESGGAADFEAGDSVVGFDAADLEALGAQSIADLASFTPNLEIVTAGATTPTFFIRGVGLNDFNANSSGAVAIYFNDVPKNSPALQLGTLFDIENVNILRGPQGKGNYRSASAGAIKIYTKKPTGQYNAFLTQSYGNYNAVDFQGAVGAPIFEDIVAGRLAFRFSDRDGYGKNGCGGAPSKEERGVRPASDINATAFDPRWSICGEQVNPLGVELIDFPGEISDGRSRVPAGLPERINNQHNWAARGSLLFQPTLDQEWLFTASGGKRDELTRQGQAYGTFAESRSPIGPFGTRGRGVLGGSDAFGYVPKEVDIRRLELDPCKVDGTTFAAYNNPTFETNCLRSDGSSDPEKIRYADGLARQLLARELAKKLDSEPHSGDYNNPGDTKLETWGVSLKGDMVFGNNLHVTSVTGYDHYDRFVGNDLDQSPNLVFEILTKDDGWQFVQTLDMTGEVAEDVPVTWEIGAFYLYEELNVAVDNTFGGLARFGVSERQYKQKLWSGAAHAGFIFSFWEKFALDAGLRYNWERKSINYLLVRGFEEDFPLFARETWQAPSGQIRLTYNFSETIYSYWKYTRGWKGGHFNATGGDDGVFPADPESIDAFEMGLHGSVLNGLLTIDLSLFHYNYKDYQLFTAVTTLTQIEFEILNASDVEVYGSELDITLRPNKIGPFAWEGLMLQANVGWLESQFLDYTQVQTVRQEFGFNNPLTVNNEIQNSGNPLLNSPQFKVSLTAEQTVPIGRLGTLTARWDGAWTDDTNYDATESRGVPNIDGDQFLPKHTIGQAAYWLHNARLAYRTPSGQVEVAGWVRNITDKAYRTYAFDASFLFSTTLHFLGEPRTYGVSLTTTF